MHRVQLHTKLTLGGLAVVLGGLMLAVPLTFRAADSMLIGLKERRLRFELNEVRTSVSNLMDIGLPLAALRRTQDLIERTRTHDSEIDSVLVFDPTGKILYSTDPGEVGAEVPPHWLAPTATSQAISDSRELVVVSTLNNSFGTHAGGIALRFAMSNLAGQREEAWLLLGSLSAAGLAGAAAAGSFANRQLLMRLRAGLRQGIAELEGLVSGPRPAEPASIDHLPPALADAHRQYVDGIRTALAEMDGYTEEVSRLDDLG